MSSSKPPAPAWTHSRQACADPGSRCAMTSGGTVPSSPAGTRRGEEDHGAVKVFISSDMEGTAGVVDWSQCLAGEPEYSYYRTLLQNEVNAAIDGAAAAG